MAIGFALFTIDIVLQSLYGQRSARNPWGAGTLEWAMPMPPPPYNFASLPHVTSRTPLADATAISAVAWRAAKAISASSANGWLETLGVDTDVRAGSNRSCGCPIAPSAADYRAGDGRVLPRGAVQILPRRHWSLSLPGSLSRCCLDAPAPATRRDRGPLPVGARVKRGCRIPRRWLRRRMGDELALVADATPLPRWCSACCSSGWSRRTGRRRF